MAEVINIGTEEEIMDGPEVKEEAPQAIPGPQTAPNYTWPSDAQFSIDGASLERLLQTHQAYLSQPKAQEVIAMMGSLDILSKIVQKGIEEGKIVAQ